MRPLSDGPYEIVTHLLRPSSRLLSGSSAERCRSPELGSTAFPKIRRICDNVLFLPSLSSFAHCSTQTSKTALNV